MASKKSEAFGSMAEGLKQRRKSSDVPDSSATGSKRPSNNIELDGKRFSKIQPDDEPTAHPPGYNKKKRDIVKLILAVVAAALLRGDPKVATVLSLVSIVCLKEGTLLSVKNLKWLGLCIISGGMSGASWYLERKSEEEEREPKTKTPEEEAGFLSYFDKPIWASAKIIQLCWGTTLGVFLVSAYMHGHNSLLEFDYLWEAEKPPSGPRKEPPPKRYLLY
ncbi:expressed unknown protein [Seminavis robusta]|uniref:Uncharacterized protein n=1 Tax=Seminavis robusta TaxID=568900 RepID=A0A9N8F0N1_9STRA|nr:expressed unknown protein [Seminavis robusta]|eukprot:Sro2983_g341600.1 n/a (220) ;mRNA; r:8348-9007